MNQEKMNNANIHLRVEHVANLFTSQSYCKAIMQYKHDIIQEITSIYIAITSEHIR